MSNSVTKCVKGTLFTLPLLFGAPAFADDSDPNWTGPLLTGNARTMPAGMLNVEPYFVHYSSNAKYNQDGHRIGKDERSSQWQVLLPMFYGIIDTLSVRAVLSEGHSYSAGQSTDGWVMGDVSAGLQYMLIAPHEDGTGPVLSAEYRHRFATGKFDHLGDNPLNGGGNGADMDSFGLLYQQVAWLPNGRPLRWRATMAYTLTPDRVNLTSTSVYGTPSDFSGYARLGSGLGISTSVEYSIDRHWVLAMDVAFNRASAGRLTGTSQGQAYNRQNPYTRVYSVAPAVEYNFNGNIGVIAGVEFSVAGRNTSAYTTPQVAINMVF